MRATAKYLFDLDFGGGSTEAKPAIPLAEHAAQLAEAEATGYRNGMAMAEAQALTDSGRLTALALERLAGAFASLDQALRAVEAKLEAEAVEVAVAVGRKLAPALIAQEPLAEIAALASVCFRQIVAAPHVVVRVNDVLYAATSERLEEILRTSGFEGRLVVLADPDIAAGDCRIEWADGGVTRDRAAAEAAITEAVNRYIAARTGAAISPDNPGRSAS
jgi:flagellar assembly protein FliH